MRISVDAHFQQTAAWPATERPAVEAKSIKYEPEDSGGGQTSGPLARTSIEYAAYVLSSSYVLSFGLFVPISCYPFCCLIDEYGRSHLLDLYSKFYHAKPLTALI